jgi:hypothetical protein
VPSSLSGPQKNHLSGLKRRLLKVSFWNVQHLMEVRGRWVECGFGDWRHLSSMHQHDPASQPSTTHRPLPRQVRREIAPIVGRNRGRSGVADALSALRAEQQAQQAALLRDGPGEGGAAADGRVKVGRLNRCSSGAWQRGRD